MEYFIILYLGVFVLIMLGITAYSLRKDGIPIWPLVQSWSKEMLRLTAGFLLVWAIVIAVGIWKDGEFSSLENWRTEAGETWMVSLFIWLASGFSHWQQSVSQARRIREGEVVENKVRLGWRQQMQQAVYRFRYFFIAAAVSFMALTAVAMLRDEALSGAAYSRWLRHSLLLGLCIQLLGYLSGAIKNTRKTGAVIQKDAAGRQMEVETDR